jgi:hypothetical protein
MNIAGAALDEGSACDASRQTSALASQVRPDEPCAGVSLGASAPIGAPALPFQNARKSTCVAGNISR